MNAVLAAIRSRRVVRSMDDEPIGREALEAILDAERFPDGLEPDMIVCLGHPAAGGPAPIRGGRAITWRDLTTFVP